MATVNYWCANICGTQKYILRCACAYYQVPISQARTNLGGGRQLNLCDPPYAEPRGSSFLIFFAALRKTLSDKRRILPILTLLGIGPRHQYYPVCSIAHTFFGTTPMFATVIIGTFISLPVTWAYLGCIIIIGFVGSPFGYDILYRINSGTTIYPKF